MKNLIYIIILLLTTVACKPQQRTVEVPVETVRTSYIHDTRIDSVYVKDSVDMYVRDDTVFIYKERVRYKYLNKTDTVIKTDTIPQIVKVEAIKEVEVNHIKWYQRVLMWIGGIVSLILAGYVIYKIKLKQ